MAAPRKYSVELQQRATRMAVEARRDPASSRGAIKRIADQLGVHPEALRTWVRQAEIDDGVRPGVTTDDSTRIVELEMVPHPDQPRPEITEMDYGMVRGSLRMKLRAATAGYILRQWSVDCSPDHSLRGYEFRLWLKDHLALYGVKNAVLAPGYRSPDQNKGER